MGYIEDRAAEGQRQAFEAAKRAEIAKVMNQGVPAGLASMRADNYQDGISAEDAYRLQQAQAAKDINYQRALEKMRNAQVTNGKIDPSYWDAAQRASDYEILNGLAGRGIQ